MDKHLHANEKVLWSDKPVRATFISPALVFGLLIGLIFLITGIFISNAISATPNMSAEGPALVVAALVLGIPAFVLIVGPLIWQFMRYRNTEYMITNQRIITQTGAIGLDTRFVDLDRVQEVYVNVAPIDKLFGTGSVIAVTAGYVHVSMDRPSLVALREPYEVQKLLQEAMKKAQTMEKE